MTERAHGEQTPYENLTYGRDLFVQFFHDDSALVNLGYSAKQRQFTVRALSLISEEGAFLAEPKPRVYFGKDKPVVSEEGYPHLWLTTLDNGGYKAIAEYPARWIPDRYEADKNYISWGDYQTDLRSEEFGNTVVAVIDMLPAENTYEDIDMLIKHLYEGAWLNHYHQRNPAITKPSPFNWLRTRVSTSVAIFKAGWVDEDTKLELVVETDVYARVAGITGSHYSRFEPEKRKDLNVTTEVWRRLPVIERDGLVWVPFGKKPNPSNESIKKALEGKKEKQLSFGGLTPSGQTSIKVA